MAIEGEIKSDQIILGIGWNWGDTTLCAHGISRQESKPMQMESKIVAALLKLPGNQAERPRPC